MNEPTITPTVQIALDGEARILKYGFRAYEAMNLNPFDPESVRAFSARPLSPRVAAELIHAGLLHEHAKKGPRYGQEPLSVEDIIDLLDFPTFVALFGQIQKAMGTDDEPGEGATTNPPAA